MWLTATAEDTGGCPLRGARAAVRRGSRPAASFVPAPLGDRSVHARLHDALVAGRRAPGRPAARHARPAVLRLRLRSVGRGLHGGRGAHGTCRGCSGVEERGVDTRLIEADVARRRRRRRRTRRRAPARRRRTRRCRPRGARPGRRAALEHRDRRRGERARRRVDRAVPVGLHALLDELGIELSPPTARATTSTSTSGQCAPPRGRRHAARGTRARVQEADAKLDALAKELDPEAPWEHPTHASSTRSPSTSGSGPRSPTRRRARTCARPGSRTASSRSRRTRFSLLQGSGRSPARAGRTSSSRPSSASPTASSAAPS